MKLVLKLQLLCFNLLLLNTNCTYFTSNITPSYISPEYLYNPVFNPDTLNQEWLINNIFKSKKKLIRWIASQDIIRMSNFTGSNSNYNWTLLHAAASSGIYDLVYEIVQQKTNLNVLDHKHRTPLYLAIKNDHEQIAELLIEYGADVNIREIENGETPIFPAINSSLELIDLLLEHGANINDIDFNKKTLLHKAAINNNIEAAKHLLTKNTNINAIDKEGYTCTDLAFQQGYTDLTKILRSNRGNFTGHNNSLKMLILNDLDYAFRYSLNLNTNLLDKPTRKDSLYRLAIVNNRLNIAKMLIDRYISNLDITNKFIAIYLAHATNNPEIILHILNKISIMDIYIVLSCSIQRHDVDLVKSIINNSPNQYKNINNIAQKAIMVGNGENLLFLLGLGADASKLKEDDSYKTEINRVIRIYKNQKARIILKAMANFSRGRRCLICLELGERIQTECCKKFFHQECLDHWLEENLTCPHCKEILRYHRSEEEVGLEHLCDILNRLLRNHNNSRVSDTEFNNEIMQICYTLNALMAINGYRGEGITPDILIEKINRVIASQTRNEVTIDNLTSIMGNLMQNNQLQD